MPTIEISHETYAQLQARARPFEDTPDSVIQRLLGGEAGADEEPSGRPLVATTERAAPGSILSERAYWAPILRVLVELGGRAPAPEVIDRVGDILAEDLTPRDREQLQTGEIRWRNRAQFARLRMKQLGLLAANSQRGVWEITETGRDYLEALARGTG